MDGGAGPSGDGLTAVKVEGVEQMAGGEEGQFGIRLRLLGRG